MKISTIPPDAFRIADRTVSRWHCWVPLTTRSEDVTKSAFWVHVLRDLVPGSLVDIVTPDGLLDMTVRIVGVNNSIVRVNVLRHYEDVAARAPMFAALEAQGSASQLIPGGQQAQEIASRVPEGYKVGYNPGKKTYYVVLKASGQKISEGYPTREQALDYSIAHAKASGVDVDEAAA